MKKQLKRVRKGIYAKKPSYMRGIIKRKKIDKLVVNSLQRWHDLSITLGETTFGLEEGAEEFINRFTATNELAWRKNSFSQFGDNKILVQKWVDVFNGTEYWREVETLN